MRCARPPFSQNTIMYNKPLINVYLYLNTFANDDVILINQSREIGNIT